MTGFSAVEVLNRVTGDIHFTVQWSGGTSPDSGTFSPGASQTINLGSLGISDGTKVYPVVVAVRGVTETGPSVVYEGGPSGLTANYSADGRPDNFGVEQ